MKKILVLIAVFTVLSAFCSCAAGGESDGMTSVFAQPYEADVSVSEDGDIYSAKITLSADGRLDIVFYEPTILCGISYGFSDGDSYLVYNDLSIKLDGKNVADKVSGGVYSWKKLLSPEGEFTVKRIKDGENTYIVLSNGEAEYRFDEKTGKPLTVSDKDTIISFTEFKSINERLSESTG